MWSQESISKWHSFCFMLEEWSGPKPQSKLSHHSQSTGRQNHLKGAGLEHCVYKKMKTCAVGPEPRGQTDSFKRPILLGGERPGLQAQWTPQRVNRKTRSDVQRQFTPASCVVFTVPEILGLRKPRSELLLHFSLASQIPSTTRKSFEATQT